MSEFIGSRISLISKSDIRYVGRLHEINSADSTVSLEEVRSFGSEGRRGNPDDEIPPSDQVYEYIVFRGSDVKDLTIVEPPKENQPPAPPQMPNDPAILGSTRPPQQPQHQNQQFRGPPPPQQQPYSPFGGYPPQPQQQQPQQQQSRFAPPGGPHGFPGAPGAVPGYGMPFGGPPPPGWYPPPGHGFPQGPPGQGPPGQFGPPQNGPGPQMRGGPPHGGPSPLNQQHQGQNNVPMGGNMPKQSTPPQAPGMHAPPPPNDTKPTELSATPAPASASDSAPPLPNESKPETSGKPQGTEQRPKPATATRNSRVAVPLANKPAQQAPKGPAGGASSQQASRQASQQVPQQPPQQTQTAAQAAAAAVAAAMAKLGPAQERPPPSQGHRDGMDNLTEKVQQMRTDERTKHSRQPGTGGYAAGNRGGRGGRRPSTRAGIDVPTTDFDFESSNAKFNKQDLVKEAIATGSPAGTPGENDGGNPLNGTSVHTGAAVDGHADGEDVVIPEAAGQKAYNKSSSFFDNISSELKDRNSAQEDGKRLGGREFRSEERNKNFETFGQGSVDSGYRGGFRGRGRGRGFGGRGRGFSGPRGGGFAPRGRGAPAEA